MRPWLSKSAALEAKLRLLERIPSYCDAPPNRGSPVRVVVVVVLVVPVAESAPEYGVGHCAASVFHFSGESPLVIEQLWLMLLCMLIDVIADAVQATCPSTGRLATVITTGATARPPRSSLRRLSDDGFGSFGGFWSDFIMLN